MPPKLRILTFTSLYPNAAMPNFGIFVENRIRRVAQTGEAEVQVVAPVPWFPSRRPVFGRYARWASVPRREVRHGLEVLHPTYPLLPKFGMLAHPLAMAAAAMPDLHRLRRQGFDFDLIDAHFFYPDGVAALLLGRWLRRPVVITGRGTDLNLYPQRHPVIRPVIAWAARHAAASIAVSTRLRDVLVELGAPPARVHVLRNGVDLEQFRPSDRERARRDLRVTKLTLASVGNLVELKGHHLVIEALTLLPDWQLLIAGEGPERGRLTALATSLGVGARVTFLGEIPHEQMASIYSAADILVLASSREGWPNVVLEAMACGTPVVATAVGGVTEMLSTPMAGRLLEERSTAAIAAKVRDLLADGPDRAATRSHAETFSWEAITAGQVSIFRKVLAERRPAPQRCCAGPRPCEEAEPDPPLATASEPRLTPNARER
jgi:glycosyltransferase involved in cell wall biosynthesis